MDITVTRDQGEGNGSVGIGIGCIEFAHNGPRGLVLEYDAGEKGDVGRSLVDDGGGIFRIGAGSDFLSIGEPIPIAVGIVRIGAGGHLGPVGRAVSVGVGIGRVGVGGKLGLVGYTVAVMVASSGFEERVHLPCGEGPVVDANVVDEAVEESFRSAPASDVKGIGGIAEKSAGSIGAAIRDLFAVDVDGGAGAGRSPVPGEGEKVPLVVSKGGPLGGGVRRVTEVAEPPGVCLFHG